MRRVTLLLATGATFAVAATSLAIAALPTSRPAERDVPVQQRAEVVGAFAHLPLSFIENRGQVDDAVRYYAQGDRFAFYTTPNEVMLSFSKPPTEDGSPSAEGVALGLRFVGQNRGVEPHGEQRLPGVINSLHGDPSEWLTGIAQFGEIVYDDVWPGIDVRLRERSGVLEYEFHVAPGASPADIRLAYDGAQHLALGKDGGLRIATSLGVLEDSAPRSYQYIDGVRVPVQSGYALGGESHFAFSVDSYRHDHELVIDPGVQYTTFLGGNSAENGAGIAVDSAGNAYVTGTTQSPDFPTTVGAFRRTGAASNFGDVFVSKLNAAGTALVYSTFVGGSDFEFGRRLAIDGSGNAYVTGQTKSSNFPTTGSAFDRTLNIPPNCPRCATDNTDNFVFKLNASGSALVYSTYLGGTDYDAARGIAVDSAGNAYVTGETLSGDFPTTAGAFDRVRGGEYDVFVTKLNASGSALAYSTFVGGAAVDNGERISVDAGGNAYVLGFSSSTDFPTTTGAFDRTASGGFDATVTKLNGAGSALVYSTYLGGSDFDTGYGLALDGGGNAYITGNTPSADFPTTAGAYDRTFNAGDGFVTKLNAAGSAAVYSTFIGGSSGESVNAVVVDSAGNAWLSGDTSSTDFPVTAGAPDTSFNGGAADAFIAELDATGSALPFSTFLGGSESESAADIARDPTGDVYVTGLTYSQNFPATTGAFDRVFNGDISIFWGDAFITKIDIDATTSTPPAPPGVPAAPTLTAPSNASSVPQPITFDWNNVPEAVSYTIQIDDSSAFTTPLVRQQSVTSSVYATSGLASTTHFWRVRGVNSAGTAGAWSAVRSFTPQAAPPPAELTNVDVNPSTVVGGDASSGTIVMSAGPVDDAVISLTSSNPAVAAVPATVIVPANSFTGTFTVTTSSVSASTTVTITATYNGSTRSALLTVTPPGAPTVTLQSVTISPSSVTGGNNTSGFVSLSGGAPAGGATVSLSSSDPGVASVPPSVTVPAGTTAFGFTVPTTTVTATTSVTITATYNGIARTATLTVNAGTPPPPPPSNVTVSVTATGRGGEHVVSTPAGLDVVTGSTGSATFAAGTSITLKVASGRDVIWSGACSSGGNKTKTCTFTANANSSVTANIQ